MHNVRLWKPFSTKQRQSQHSPPFNVAVKPAKHKTGSALWISIALLHLRSFLRQGGSQPERHSQGTTMTNTKGINVVETQVNEARKHCFSKHRRLNGFTRSNGPVECKLCLMWTKPQIFSPLYTQTLNERGNFKSLLQSSWYIRARTYVRLQNGYGFLSFLGRASFREPSPVFNTENLLSLPGQRGQCDEKVNFNKSSSWSTSLTKFCLQPVLQLCSARRMFHSEF